MLFFKNCLFTTLEKATDKCTKTRNLIAPTLNDESEIPDRSYSVPDIQDYIKYIIKKT